MKPSRVLAISFCVIAICGCAHMKHMTSSTKPVNRDVLLKELSVDNKAIEDAAAAARQLQIRKGAKVLFIDGGYRYGMPQVLRREMAKEFTLIPQTETVNDSTDAPKLRYMAATAGCDYIFYVEQNSAVSRNSLPSVYFSWIPIIGWFGIPDRQLEADVQLSVMVVDTLTGASFIEASEPIQKKTACVPATHQFVENRIQVKAAKEAVQSLLDRLRARMK